MGLLDAVDWQGKIFKNGEWTTGRGGDYPVVEPATGAELGRMGRATAAVLCFVLWFSLVAQVFVAQFVNYVPVRGWLNQPLVQLPWIRYVPSHLLDDGRGPDAGGSR